MWMNLVKTGDKIRIKKSNIISDLALLQIIY